MKIMKLELSDIRKYTNNVNGNISSKLALSVGKMCHDFSDMLITAVSFISSTVYINKKVWKVIYCSCKSARCALKNTTPSLQVFNDYFANTAKSLINKLSTTVYSYLLINGHHYTCKQIYF